MKYFVFLFLSLPILTFAQLEPFAPSYCVKNNITHIQRHSDLIQPDNHEGLCLTEVLKYDHLGRLTYQEKHSRCSSLDQTSTYEYNGTNLHHTGFTQKSGSFVDKTTLKKETFKKGIYQYELIPPRDASTAYTAQYNDNGQILKETSQNAQDKKAKVFSTIYSYNKDGRLSQITTHAGEKMTRSFDMSYDEQGRIKSMVRQSGGGISRTTYAYTYPEEGKIQITCNLVIEGRSPMPWTETLLINP